MLQVEARATLCVCKEEQQKKTVTSASLPAPYKKGDACISRQLPPKESCVSLQSLVKQHVKMQQQTFAYLSTRF